MEIVKDELSRWGTMTTGEIKEFSVTYSTRQVAVRMRVIGAKFVKPYVQDCRSPDDADDLLKNLGWAQKSLSRNERRKAVIGFLDEFRVHDDKSVIRTGFVDLLFMIIAFRMMKAFFGVEHIWRRSYRKCLRFLAKASYLYSRRRGEALSAGRSDHSLSALNWKIVVSSRLIHLRGFIPI